MKQSYVKKHVDDLSKDEIHQIADKLRSEAEYYSKHADELTQLLQKRRSEAEQDHSSNNPG